MANPLSQKKAKEVLCENGWSETIGGKHSVKMVKPGHRPITLPMPKGRDYSQGLTRAILRQAGIES